ncbi:MAG TPA: TetR/AcrR family transcriptional regulator, partial [Nevskiaceae bacterium]|nr:TetR/AcrR family transcriptional regulator [Nevskiaceae bacterium]
AAEFYPMNSDIAARAGVHHALIKYHYHSKEQLWRAAVTFLFHRQAGDLTFDPPPGAMATPEGRREHAREILRRIVRYSAQHPEHARLMVQESVRDSKRLRWLADTFVTHTSRAALNYVRLLKQEGMVPDVSESALVYIIVGAAQQFYTLAPEVKRVWKIDPSKPAVIDAHVDAMLKVLLR